MRRSLLLGLVFLVSTSPVLAELKQAANYLNDYEQRSGWQLLFDGKTTDGWRNYQSDSVSAKWTISRGVLATSKGGGDLITKEQYDNFELSIEYRISAGGNSGVLFHVTEDGKKPWHSGPAVSYTHLRAHGDATLSRMPSSA